MNKVFLLSYLGGMHGEFLAGLITANDNFYRKGMSQTVETNRYHYSDPLLSLCINIKPVNNKENYPKLSESNYIISETEKQRIDQSFNEKNLLVLTHAFGSSDMFNLPRRKLIRLYSSDEYAKRCLILAIVKSWVVKYPTTRTELLDFLSSKKIPNHYVKKIFDRGYFYWFERIALTKSALNLDRFVADHFHIYRESNRNVKSAENWLYLDVEKLIKDPFNTANLWKNIFNITDLDCAAIEEYNIRNIELIDSTFGRIGSDQELINKCADYIKQTCPDNIFQRFNTA